ncbi:hypothetical protein S83_036393 [Arachis hypogaea]
MLLGLKILSQNNNNNNNKKLLFFFPFFFPSSPWLLNLPLLIFLFLIRSFSSWGRFLAYDEVEGPLEFDSNSSKTRGFAFFMYKTEEGARTFLDMLVAVGMITDMECSLRCGLMDTLF